LPSRFLPSTSERPTDARACSFLLPTPTAEPFDGRDAYATKGKASLETLASRGLLPTPTVKGNHAEPRETGRSGTGLATAVAAAGPLSPRFVEWLMGFPDGWTDCEPLAMPLFPSAPRPSDD
jgi:DNA (cytosine-5)-methyltransferase 1